ncbi:MAG: C25 family cysteine peptidase [Bacteroidales bacterium]|nr:C25 family cysteine peptidase [Bacteroidales bacterium]
MKRILFIVFLLLGYFSFAQYTNDWIDFSQKYYRIPVTSEGVYKVTYADLVANGISVGDFDHRNLQIVHNGKVLPLFVSAQADGIFRSTDYFEFYAEGGNTGWLDSRVYTNRRSINEAYSLYNDTASYFLTFANTLSSPRYDTTRATNYSSYSPTSYWFRTVRQNYHSTFNATNNSPYILPSEGWTDAYFDMGGNVQKTLATPNYASVGLPAKISYGLGGWSETQHDVIVTLSSDASIRIDTTYYEYNAIHYSFETKQPLANTTTVTVQSIGGDKTADKNALSYVEITYPSKTSCSNLSMYSFLMPVVESDAEYILLDITNCNAGTQAPIVYCPDLGLRLLTTKVDDVYKVLIPNIGKSFKCIVLSQKAYSRISEIQSIQTKSTTESKFVDYSLEENQGDYIIIAEKSLWNQARLYKQYREQTGKKVVLVDIDELYNEFAYGVWKHPYAIIGFLNYASTHWKTRPENVFLIGKGFHVSNFRNSESLYARTLIPPMGNPGGDLLYTVDARANSIYTSIGIGRLAAETEEEVSIYRKKVIDYESQIPSPWMKNVLHFGGGSTLYEQSLFRYYLSQYESILKKEYFGADVHSFFKESSDVYETTEPEAIRKYMNEGTTLMTFFGHASGSGFDQSVDHPSQFDNQGKYPLVLANSCYSGDIFADNDYNVSKIWVFAENRGAIGFLANVGAGVPSYLNIFSSALMRNIAYSNYGKSIGTCIAKTLSDISNRSLIYEDLYDGIMGFTLNGDPAISLHSFKLPDLEVNESSIIVSPTVVTTDLERFTISVAVTNNGRAYGSDFGMKLVLTSSSGEEYTIDTTVTGAYCHDIFDFVIDMNMVSSGEYTIQVEVDYDNTIEELSEANNTASHSFFISTRDVSPIYPPKFAIIPTDTVTLQMSSVDAFNPPSAVLVEIDTTAEFSSSLKQSATIALEGKALISWKPEMKFIDGTTYFWRVTTIDSVKWNTSSFTYENGQTGWGQIHRKQFSDNALTRLSYNDTTKKYSFLSTPHEVLLQTRGNCSTEKEYFECLFVEDATLRENSGFPLSSPALHVIVMDSTSLDIWMSNKASYGQRNYPSANGRVRYHLAFTSNSAASQKALAKFLLDTVPSGAYIMCYSFKQPYCQSWDVSLKNAMDSLGFSAYKTTPNDYPYIFYTQKGHPEVSEEVVGTSPTDLIRFTKKLSANHDDGYVVSPFIGPAKSYRSVQWNATKTDKDYSYLSVFGVMYNDESYVIRNMFDDVWNGLDTIIKPEYFPCMQLSCYMQDTSRTPIDLNSWKVYFDPQIELAVTPEFAYSFRSPEVEQGDSIHVIVSAQNVTAAKGDSILVMYEIRNEQNELSYLLYKRIGTVGAYEHIVDSVSIATSAFKGNYTMKIEFNPINPETGEYDMPEQTHFNNVYHTTFTVLIDEKAPVMDVQIDGRHILNGDNVSAAPTILVTLFDENEYFSVSDTSLYTVYVENVATGERMSYNFSDSTLVLIPSGDDRNVCQVICRPLFTSNGVYELHVQARDVTGNVAASQEYVVQFEIVQERKVSILYNYPNPCKEFTTFRFVLTGDDVPEHAQILICDSEGRRVKSLPLQNIHIGTNTIDMYWDGRDERGVALPNGLYLYYLDFENKSDWETMSLPENMRLRKKYGKLLLER